MSQPYGLHGAERQSQSSQRTGASNLSNFACIGSGRRPTRLALLRPRCALHQLQAFTLVLPQAAAVTKGEGCPHAMMAGLVVQQERLEGDLTAYKANLVKESIRMGHNDLGDFFYAAGDLQA